MTQRCFWHLPSVLQREPQATLTGESANMSPEPQQETNVSVQQPQRRAHPTETPSKIKCFTLPQGEKQLVTSTLCLLPSSATEKETKVLFQRDIFNYASKFCKTRNLSRNPHIAEIFSSHLQQS